MLLLRICDNHVPTTTPHHACQQADLNQVEFSLNRVECSLNHVNCYLNQNENSLNHVECYPVEGNTSLDIVCVRDQFAFETSLGFRVALVYLVLYRLKTSSN